MGEFQLTLLLGQPSLLEPLQLPAAPAVLLGTLAGIATALVGGTFFVMVVGRYVVVWWMKSQKSEAKWLWASFLSLLHLFDAMNCFATLNWTGKNVSHSSYRYYGFLKPTL